MFSVVSAVLLRPPPYTNPQQLVIVDNQPPNAQPGFVSPAEFFDHRRMSRTTSAMAQIQSFNANINGGDVLDRVDAVAVSPNFFTLLSVPPFLDRSADYRVETMSSVVDAAIGQRRFAARLFAAFAALSLALAGIGVYGLIAQSVAYRRREIGLRLALGADPNDVPQLIVKDAMILGASGVGLGLVLSLALTRLLESQLFGVASRDPVVFGAIVPVLLLVAAAASYLPGRDASRLNPVSAVQSE